LIINKVWLNITRFKDVQKELAVYRS